MKLKLRREPFYKRIKKTFLFGDLQIFYKKSSKWVQSSSILNTMTRGFHTYEADKYVTGAKPN